MGIYITLFLTILIMLVLESSYDIITIARVHIKTRSLAYSLIVLFILLLGTLKGIEYGYDAESYKLYYFDYFSNVSFRSAMMRGVEPGFAILTYLITRITTQYWVFRAIIFLLAFGGIAKVIWMWSQNVSLSFLLWISLGFLSFDMFILRQAIAVTIIFMGIKYLNGGKYFKFSLFIIIAICFHYTAIFAFILLPLSSKRFRGAPLFKRALYLIGSVVTGAFLLPRLIDAYLINDYSEQIVAGEGYGFLLAIMILFFLIGLIRKKYTDNSEVIEDKIRFDKDAIFEFCLGSVYFQIIALFFSVFNRVTYIPLAFTLVCVPNCINSLEKGIYKVVCMALGVFCFQMFYMTILSASDLIPYISIFE